MNRSHNRPLLLLCLFCVLSSASFGQSPGPLTQQELQDLDRLLPHTLRWLAIWNDTSFVCSPAVRVNWFDDWKALQGKIVPLKILRGEKHLTVAIEPLHVSLDFIRLHDRGLGPAMPTHFCESTYEQHLEGQRRLLAGSPELEKSVQEMRSNPRIGSALDALEQRATPFREAGPPVQETSEFVVPSVTPVSRSTARRTAEAQMLSNLGIEAARKDIVKMCGPGTRFKLTAPTINVADPFMYVLVEDLETRESCIETVRLWRDVQGAYDPYSGKCDENDDTVQWYRLRIEQSHPKNAGVVTCK